MKTLLVAATALSMSGAAFAYQTHSGHTGTTPQSQGQGTMQGHMQSTAPLGTATQERAWRDQQQQHLQNTDQHQAVQQHHADHQHGVVPQRSQQQVYQSTAPLGTATQERAWLDARQQMMQNWSADQRRMAEEHWAYMPGTWNQQQRTSWQQMQTMSPGQWTADQRALYDEHMRSFPTTWTEQQRTAYQQQMGHMQQPWMMHQQQMGAQQMGHQQTGQMQYGQQQQQQTAGWNPSQWAGMGGPYEEVYGDGTVDLTPRPAQTNYPPCSRPGPGEDRCIQLYESGVRTQLSQWNQATGGLAGGAEVGMGGPYEEAHGQAHGAVTGQGQATMQGGLDGQAQGYSTGQTGVAYQGVGGPLEARDGYPPCQPGPGDDRCIQLYERGVTGRD
ncbi:MAG: hypothetical protein ACK4K7_05935 [Allosphingosinicella sp.]|uniref:hypothetical protein n=1 Tax=Allosphingosinicella sp. TaxID=2823234 RepID=UPI0039622C31